MSTPTEDEPTPTRMVATCHTEGCPMSGVPITALMYPPYTAQCAQCGERVADVRPA